MATFLIIPRHSYATMATAALSVTFIGLSSPSALAASATWSATPTSQYWEANETETNWAAPGTYPGSTSTPNNTDVATFSSNSLITNVVIDSATSNALPLYIAGIGFTTNELVTNYTIGTPTGNALVLTSNANQTSTTNQVFISGSLRAAATTAVIETVAAPLVLAPQATAPDGFYVFQNNSTAVPDRLLINGPVTGGSTTGTITLTLRGANSLGGSAINGTISNGAATNFALVKSDAGTWTINGNTSYTGGTTVNGGTLVLTGHNTFNAAATGANAIIVSSGATLSVNSIGNALGGATRVNLGGGSNTGRLIYTGTGETTGLVIGSTAFNAGTGLILNQSGTGLLKFTSNLAQTPVAQTLTLQGSSNGIGEFGGALTDTGTAAALSVTKTGTGKWVLSGANTYSGATTITDGTLGVTPAAQAPILSGAGGVNIQGGRLVLDYTGQTSPAAQVKALLDAEYATAVANATQPFVTGQIRSSTLTAGRTLGYGDNGLDSVTVRVTLGGDADLDGDVDFNDFLALQSSFGTAGTRFDQGNFDYNGQTDFNDFLALQANFGQSLTGDSPAITAAEFAQVMSIHSASAVPEPACLTLLGMSVAGLIRRRNRSVNLA